MATSSAAFDDLLQLADQLGSEFDERDSHKNRFFRDLTKMLKAEWHIEVKKEIEEVTEEEAAPYEGDTPSETEDHVSDDDYWFSTQEEKTKEETKEEKTPERPNDLLMRKEETKEENERQKIREKLKGGTKDEHDEHSPIG